MNIGNRLSEFRKTRSLSQGDVAKAVGVNQPDVDRYEKGRKIPHTFLNSFADRYGWAEMVWLVCAKRIEPESKVAVNNEISEMRVRLDQTEKIFAAFRREYHDRIDGVLRECESRLEKKSVSSSRAASHNS